ncbi:MAG: hypothetical protein SFY68_10050 [Candidatus Sumerlaeia bacterium]|nr:hypothetical protein [Candidatus Sumerlaeia bacterium]
MSTKKILPIFVVGTTILLLLILWVYSSRGSAVQVAISEPPVKKVVEVAPATPSPVVEERLPEPQALAEASPTPEPTPELALPAAPLATPDASLPPTVLTVLILEEGTRMPLESVDVEVIAVADGSTNPFNAPPAPENPFPAINPDEQEPLKPTQAITGTDGRAVLTMPASAMEEFKGRELALVTDWGVGPRHQVPLKLNWYNSNTLEVIYPGRKEFLLEVRREDETPVSGLAVAVDVRQYAWNRPGGFFLTQQTQTDAEGKAIFLAYAQDRTPLVVATEELVYFKGSGRRSSDGNPVAMFTNLREGEAIRLTLVEDAVRAIGTLKNVPDTLKNITMTATVEGGGVNYFTLPVKDNKVTFSTPVSAEVNLFIVQAGDDGDIRRRFQGPPPSVEHKMVVKMPDQSGVYEFDIAFAERREVLATVYLPDGEPAKGVRIRGLGFGEGVAAEDSTNQRNAWRSRLGRIDGESSIRSQLTGSDGKTLIDVPPAASYLFKVDPDTLPEDAKGVDTTELTWADIEAGKELVFQLKPSSLLWGRVVDRAGAGVPNAEVNLRGPDIPWNDPLFQTRTLEDGSFELNVPPIRLTEVDPQEPPDYYVFATGRNVGGGLGKASIDSPEEPVVITLNPYKAFRLKVENQGVPVTNIEFAQLYDVPGFEMPISSRSGGTREDEDGIFRFNFLIEDVSSLNIWAAESDGSTFVMVPVSAEIVNNATYIVDLANPDKFELIPEENGEGSAQGGGPGGAPGGGALGGGGPGGGGGGRGGNRL